MKRRIECPECKKDYPAFEFAKSGLCKWCDVEKTMRSWLKWREDKS